MSSDASPEVGRRATLHCNGEERALGDVGSRLLIDVLRRDFGLTGTKLGCGTGDCGACTVLLDGEAVNSCLVYAAECEGSTVETVEHLADGPVGRVVADRLVAAGGIQCGICTPGFVVMATAFLRQRPPGDCTRAEVEEALGGNLCRCTGYLPIIDAVIAAAQQLDSERAVR